jgi:hypothetical protein
LLPPGQRVFAGRLEIYHQSFTPSVKWIHFDLC